MDLLGAGRRSPNEALRLADVHCTRCALSCDKFDTLSEPENSSVMGKNTKRVLMCIQIYIEGDRYW